MKNMKKELDNSQRINAPIGAGSFSKSPDYEFVYTADDMEKGEVPGLYNKEYLRFGEKAEKINGK